MPQPAGLAMDGEAILRCFPRFALSGGPPSSGPFGSMASSLLRSRASQAGRHRREGPLQLADIGWFHLLDPSSQAQVQDALKVRSVAAGDVIVRAGQDVQGWHGLFDGFAVVEPPPGSGLARCGVPRGGWFGEHALFTGEPADCNVAASVPSVIAVLPRAVLLDLVTQQPAFSSFLVQVVAQRLQALRQRGACPQRLGTDARVAHALAQMFAAAVLFDGDFRLDLTQSALSRFLGLSRQRTNIALNHLQRRGEIEIVYRGLRVNDPRRLMRRALAGEIGGPAMPAPSGSTIQKEHR